MDSPYDSTTSQPDEISIFLQQILLRSSSDRVPAQNQETEPGLFPGRVGPVLNPGSGIWVPTNGSSSYVGTSFDNDPDEYDCESEEGVETLVEEAAQKQRNCSKRSRAAEVHNLSEKRRRSRINEKMKALQNLIPNSNKTDKASMLDEAIEYLKQLQLQVQMLTLRNGLSLYPICLPGMMPPDQILQTRMDVCERSTSLMEQAISMEQGISGETLLGLRDKQAPVANFSTSLGPKSTSEFESSFQNHLEPFQFTRSPAGVCSDMLLSSHQQLNEWCPTSLAGNFEKQATNCKDNTIEACLSVGGTDKLSSLLNGTVFSSQLKNSDNGGRLPFDDIKTESDEF